MTDAAATDAPAAAPRTQRTPLRIAAAVAAVALAAASFVLWGLTAHALLAVAFELVLVAVTVTDVERRIIPNRIVVPAAALILPARTLLDPSPQWAIAALGAFAFLFVAALVSPGGMGMGDVKLAFVIGAMLGRDTPPALALGLVLAMAPSIWILARHGRKGRKMGFAFGPFLAAGALALLLAHGP